jgi:radical SAM superfamily enzyme YgiQ (UPF0313 family)
MDLSIGIVTLNAKYIHSSLSLRYLRNAAQAAGFANVWIEEFTINQPIWKIAARINERKPDVLGLSVYIWNRSQSFELIERLQKQNPGLSVVLGGPEVSFEPELAENYTVIAGEGEKKFVEFLRHQEKQEPPTEETRTRWNSYGQELPDLLPAYRKEDMAGLKGRIAYLETSRGCPYLCSFCLSALDQTVRYFDDATQMKQIELLADAGVRCVKFVDRTFNLKPARMITLMAWLTKFTGLSFHFEVVADLLTEDLMDFLETVPPGMFQFEIGIQSTHEETQKKIHRKQDNHKLFDTITRLVRQNRIHFHCDLIFGLPGENLDGALASFSEVIALKPHELQLGFLKFLPGAPILELIGPHQYQYQSHPPYEFLSHKDLSAREVIYLKKFTEVFDLFYNSKRFRFSIEHLFTTQSAVAVFDRLLDAMEEADLLFQSLSLDAQYRLLHDTFGLGDHPLTFDLLKLDYLYAQRVYRLPGFLNNGLKQGQKTWREDRRTPVIPFTHEIHLEGQSLQLTPLPHPRFYAIVHPEPSAGYMQAPTVQPVEVECG